MIPAIKSGPNGARVYGLKPEMLWAFIAACFIYQHHGAEECVLTSGAEGVHSAGSLHYAGLGIDLRPPNTFDGAHRPLLRSAVFNDLKNSLGDEYDVIDEGNHFHIEYQPKKGVNA